MLIQNTSNIAQAPQPARLASDGAPVAVVAAPSKPSVAVDQVAAKPVAEQQPSAEQLKNVVDNINKALKQSNKNLEFSVDDSTQKTVFKLKDTATGDVIRQYPTEDMMEISRAIGEIQQG